MILDKIEYVNKKNTPSGWGTAIGVIVIGVPVSYFEAGLVAIIGGVVGGLLGNEIEYQYKRRFDRNSDRNTEALSNEETDSETGDRSEDLAINGPEIDVPRNERLSEDIISIRNQLAEVSNRISEYTKEYEALVERAASKEGVEREHLKVKAQSLLNRIKLEKKSFNSLSRKFILLTYLHAGLESGRINESKIEKITSTLSEESEDWENVLQVEELSNILGSEELIQEMRSILDQTSELYFTDPNIDDFDNGIPDPEDFET